MISEGYKLKRFKGILDRLFDFEDLEKLMSDVKEGVELLVVV